MNGPFKLTVNKGLNNSLTMPSPNCKYTSARGPTIGRRYLNLHCLSYGALRAGSIPQSRVGAAVLSSIGSNVYVVGFQRKWILLARNTRTVARNMRTVTCNTRTAARNFAQRNSDWKPYQQVNYQVKTCLFFCISSIIFQIAGIKTLFITCTASSL